MKKNHLSFEARPVTRGYDSKASAKWMVGRDAGYVLAELEGQGYRPFGAEQDGNETTIKLRGPSVAIVTYIREL